MNLSCHIHRERCGRFAMLNDYCIFSIEVADLKTEAIINMINPCRRFFSLQTSLSHPIPITLIRVLNHLHAGSHSTNTERCLTVGEEGPPWYTLPEQARRRRGPVCMPKSARDTYALWNSGMLKIACITELR